MPMCHHCPKLILVFARIDKSNVSMCRYILEVHTERAASKPTLPTLLSGAPDPTTQYDGGSETDFKLESEPVSPIGADVDLGLETHSVGSPGVEEDPAVQLDQVPQDEPGIVVAVEEVELSEVSEVSEEGIGSDRRSIALEPLMP